MSSIISSDIVGVDRGKVTNVFIAIRLTLLSLSSQKDALCPHIMEA